jgi:HD-like signal output (HDOD) protein
LGQADQRGGYGGVGERGRGKTSFLLLPQLLVETHEPLVRRREHVHLLAWEALSGHGGAGLRRRIQNVFEVCGIGGLFDRAHVISYRVLQQRVEKRMANLHTLPTLPEVVMRIVAVIGDDDSTPEDLEEVLRSDSAIVHKLLQIVNTTAFAGAGHRGEWTLKDAIVRLGRRKLGSIALQIKLINSLVKPEDSHVDLRRFWVHSVGCAYLADKIYSDKLVEFEEDLGANEYWIAALLHDIGKLILGFFFWSYYERLESLVTNTGVTFREAELRLGDTVSHQQVGQLLLMTAGMDQVVVKAVGSHHSQEGLPSSLSCLIHLADNLAKDFGLGSMEGECSQYDEDVLRVVGLNRDGLERLRKTLDGTTVAEIMDVVDRCTAS